MNFIKYIAVFALGAGAGYLVAKKVLEDHYAQLAQEEIDSVKETFSKDKPVEKLVKSGKSEEKEAPASAKRIVSVPKDAGKMTPFDPLTRNPYEQAKKNYNLISQKAKMEAELDEDDEENEDEEPETDAAGFAEGDFEEIPARDLSEIDRTAPYLIDVTEFGEEFPNHDKITLYYYTYDDVLCDEGEEIIDDIDGTVGWDCFKQLEMQTTSWVRNERLGADYEICAVRTSYSEAVHGINLPENLSPRERYLRKQKRRDEDSEE
jgi:hypothetical protein